MDHKQPGAADGSWTLSATQTSIKLWDGQADQAKNAEDMFARIRGPVPDKTRDFML